MYRQPYEDNPFLLELLVVLLMWVWVILKWGAIGLALLATYLYLT